MPFFDGATGGTKQRSLDLELPMFIADNPAIASQLAILATLAPLHGFYFQLGSNKAGTSFMFALKKDGKNIVFYAADGDTFIREMADTFVLIAEHFPGMAKDLQKLARAGQEALGDLWDNGNADTDSK